MLKVFRIFAMCLTPASLATCTVGFASDETATDVIQPAVDIARAIESYEVVIHRKSTEITLMPTEATRDVVTHTKIWCDLRKPEMVAIQREDISDGEKKFLLQNSVFVFADGVLRTNTRPNVSNAQKMSFDSFRTTSRLPYPELLGFGTVPTGLSETKDQFLDQLLQVENASVKRSPDGTATIVYRVEVEGVEALKSMVFDKTTLAPSKVSMKIGDFWTQVCSIRRQDVNDIPAPVHLRLSTDQKDPRAPNSPPVRHSDEWVDLEWKSINQPIVFPSHDKLLAAKEAEIDKLLEIPKEEEQKHP
ncbi:hypothetical protein SH449x_003668 [Pirellulaceae bacterium SH449]